MSSRDNRLISRIDNLLSTPPSTSEASSKPKIYKVHPRLRKLNETAYEPQMVAIGPIHRGKAHLKDMEQQKVSHLHQLLKRTGERSVERYVVELMNLEERARKCYSNNIMLPQGDEFVEMLLLDGVFVIEILRKIGFGGSLRDKSDYILQSPQASYALRSDLLLMENQLPFFVISQLFGMTKLQHPLYDLHYLLLWMIGLSYCMPFQQDVVDTYRNSVVHSVDDHLLGLVYQTYIYGERTNTISCIEQQNTASKLQEAGVEFKTAKNTNLMNISFADGVLQLPKLHIYHDFTEIILSNLVAYEQITDKSPHTYITDYIILISSFVKSARDVEILRPGGVIENWLEDDEAVHVMINKLAKNLVFNDSYLDIFQSLNDHCRNRHNKWMANLRRNYFNTPWAIMSVIAAIILLLLTAIQTVFAIIV